MDKTEKFFYLPQATNACFVLSPSDGPSCTPEPLEPEPEGPAGSYPCPCCGCRTFPVPKEEAIAYICPVREDLVRHARPPRPGEQPL